MRADRTIVITDPMAADLGPTVPRCNPWKEGATHGGVAPIGNRMTRISRAVLACIAVVGACVSCASPPPGKPAAPQGSSAVDSAVRVERDSTPRADSTSAAAALATVNAYYTAIEARDYRRAYELWGGEGASSRKTFEQFAAGFASTALVTVKLGTPGAIEGAAGSRYIEIPVGIHALTSEGEQQAFSGVYILRRTEVDGATPAQRRWHIDSAKLVRARQP